MGNERLRQLFQTVRRLDLTFRYNDPQLVDGGATIGTYTALKSLPAGALVLGTKMKTTEAFTGNTSAVATVGKAGATDDFFGTALDVFAAGDDYGQPATIAEALNQAAVFPIVTITSATDYTLVAAGRMTVSIYYLDLSTKAM